MNKITGMTQNGTKITYKFKATGLLMYPYEISYSYNGRKWYVDGYAKTDAEAKVNAAALLKVQVDQFNAMSKGL